MSRETNPSNPDNITPDFADEDILQEDESSESDDITEMEEEDE